MCYLQILQNTRTHARAHTHAHTLVLTFNTGLEQASRNLHKTCTTNGHYCLYIK